MDLTTIRDAFASLEGKTFEERIALLSPAIAQLAPNADNWQMIFDLLHWDWSGFKDEEGNFRFEKIHPDELDRISLKYSPFGEHQEAVIAQQIESAEEWREALNEVGMTPIQALSLAKTDLEFIKAEEDAKTAIATHPSAIAIPQAIVQMYRRFFRASERYNAGRMDTIRPLLAAKEAIVNSRSTGEDLVQEVAGQVTAKMGQIRRGTAKGRWVIPRQEDERQAIYEFANFMVYNVLEQKFRGNRSDFSSKRGIGLIEDACHFLYLLEQDKENNSQK